MSTAEIAINESQLNQRIIKALRKEYWIVELVDEWILIPNRTLAGELEKAAPVLRKLQPPVLPKTLWRGFELNSPYQDRMDSVDDYWFSSKLKPLATKKPIEYKLKGPLSFTTDRSIAEAFGDVLVTTESAALVEHSLWISDVLSWLISERRKLKTAVTQKEVIILPSVKSISVSVVSVKNRPISANW